MMLGTQEVEAVRSFCDLKGGLLASTEQIMEHGDGDYDLMEVGFDSTWKTSTWVIVALLPDVDRCYEKARNATAKTWDWGVNEGQFRRPPAYWLGHLLENESFLLLAPSEEVAEEVAFEMTKNGFGAQTSKLTKDEFDALSMSHVIFIE